MATTHDTTTTTASTPVKTLLGSAFLAFSMLALGLGTGTSFASPQESAQPGDMRPAEMQQRMADMDPGDIEAMTDHCAEAMSESNHPSAMMDNANSNGMRGMMNSSMGQGMMR
jgi:uncharacterized protein involved in copper resistance